MKFFGVSTAILGALVALSSALPVTVTPSNATSIIDMNEKNGDPKSTPFYITAPLKGTVYTVNQTVTTTWLNGINEMFLINLIKGTNPREMQLTNVSFQANGKTGSYAWMVPSNLVGGTYAFQFVYNLNGAMAQAFSNQFKVVHDGVEAATAWSTQEYNTLDEATATVSASEAETSSKTISTSASTTATVTSAAYDANEDEQITTAFSDESDY
ncbi:hypothetical protein BDF20DRAFT_835987 [Mycotypha africana]|uniref:uncharacterized protein n=1 Tax=Mycotypha africana TaxID=64632 RepID=UPI002300D48F|nr:uncharacterized protein BDF20DRAFT_835987 [Mycotypha africana]KAI8977161.1 hypothetical protein BDF20DRAFT_835987 [Mycotypha africana]